MDARCPLRRIRGLSSFDSGFVLMNQAYRGKRKSSRALLLILSDFCAKLHCQPAVWIVHKSHPPRPMSNVGNRKTLSQPAVFAWRNADFSAEDLSEMAWASVTNIESYLDYAPFVFLNKPRGFFPLWLIKVLGGCERGRR